VRGVPALSFRVSDIIEAVILEKLCDVYPSDQSGRPKALDLRTLEGRRGKAIKPHSPKGLAYPKVYPLGSRPTIEDKALKD
jgi:hypothetical protein